MTLTSLVSWYFYIFHEFFNLSSISQTKKKPHFVDIFIANWLKASWVEVLAEEKFLMSLLFFLKDCYEINYDCMKTKEIFRENTCA